MCGIVGAVARAPLAEGIERTLAHRGPDASGHAVISAGDAVVTLGHTRLAIIDLSASGAQPMATEDERFTIVFNGEIYNYRALRKELEDEGVRFRGDSDTEVLLRATARWGERAVEKLRGMFAYAVWDNEARALTLVRDRIGVKPLFYAPLPPHGIAFASEMKALLALPDVAREIDAEALDEYLSYLYFPAPRTVFRAIRKLPPAHRLVFRGGSLTVERYWRPRRVDVPRAGPDLDQAVRAKVEEAVKMRLVADVPLGAFLSGGLDSSAIVAVMARASARPVKTFCMTFRHGNEGARRYDEQRYARLVAKTFATDHTEIAVHADLLDLLPRAVEGFDEPFGNPTALLSYALCAETRRHVTVALSGDGGDEAFAGYPRHAALLWAQVLGRLPHPMLSAADRLADAFVRDSVSGFHLPRRVRKFTRGLVAGGPARYFEFVRYFGVGDKESLYSPAWRRELPVARLAGAEFLARLFDEAPASRDPLDAVSYVDVASFLSHNLLEYTDRMSMAHALEVRNPYCDHELIELALSIPLRVRAPFGRLKSLFRRAVRPWLPRAIVRRGKLGFNPPIGLWFAGSRSTVLDEMLSPASIRRRGIFNEGAIAAMIAAHRARRRDYSLHLWALVMIEAWARRVIDR